MSANVETVVQEGRRRLSVAHLLTALTVMFISVPFVDSFRYGDVAESAIFTVVLLTAVGAVGGRRRTLIAAASLAVPALGARWLSHLFPGVVPVDVGLVLAIVFVVFVIAHLFRFVVTARQVNAEVLCAAISIYLLFAIVWSFAYTLLGRADPDSFTFTVPSDANATMKGFMALYFSMQVLTTITLGDILPISNLARVMAIVEAGAGVFYLAIMIARLVGLYSSEPAAGTRQD